MGEEVEIDVEPDPEPSRLIRCADCGNGVSPLAPACPRCGRPMVMAQQQYAPAPPQQQYAPAPPQQQYTAHRVKKIDTLSGGCFVQGLGALLGGPMFLAGVVLPQVHPIVAVFGLFVVLAGLVFGRSLSTRWTCGACGSPIAGRNARGCPACQIGFT